MKKKTLGEFAVEANKNTDKVQAGELGSKMLEGFEKAMEETIEDGIKKYKHCFFIVVLLIKNDVLRVVNNKYFTRHTCPTPTFSQAVYFYSKDKKRPEFLWVIPDRNTVSALMASSFSSLHKDYQILYPFVESFSNNKLLEFADNFNEKLISENKINVA